MALRFNDGRDWFFKKRFGLFIHWGIYAIPGWHEQIQWRQGIPRGEYVKLAGQFNPRRFNPERWLDLAEEAGMEYLCFTTKHHDGFCMWDTSETEFKITRTPYGKDILELIARTCRRRGFPLCLYYSVADWNNPFYPNQGKSHELDGPEKGDYPDLARYLDFLKAQVRELCTRYGEIHGFWWDMNRTGQRDPSINNMIRSLQPKAVINDRGFDEGDFGTPEREWRSDPAADRGAFARPTEACNSLGAYSWGYKSDEDYYSTGYLIECIDSIMARGGNYLLNAGPDSGGAIAAPQARMLRAIGKWYGPVKESFSAVPCPGIVDDKNLLTGKKGSVLYVHITGRPKTGAVVLSPLKKMPGKAVLLNTGESVECRVDFLPSRFKTGEKCLRARNLPVNRLSGEVLVLKLVF